MIRELLLHLANSHHTPSQRFYDLKYRLLRKHGTLEGHDVQEVTKPCYGLRGGDYGDWQGCKREGCYRCGGTGIFDRRIYGLERWRWGRFTFHVPMMRGTIPGPLITIRGRIKHRNYGRLSAEATLWLYLICGEFRMFWDEFTGGCSFGWYAWPLKLLQRIVTPIIWRFRLHDCIYCGRRFITGTSGWCVCPRCRTAKREILEDIPF